MGILAIVLLLACVAFWVFVIWVLVQLGMGVVLMSVIILILLSIAAITLIATR